MGVPTLDGRRTNLRGRSRTNRSSKAASSAMLCGAKAYHFLWAVLIPRMALAVSSVMI